MARREPKSLFRRLTRLFRSGPVVKRKIRALDTTIAVADKTKSSGTLLFQKSLSPTYATITSNAYNLSERLMRYQDFQEMEYCLSGDTLIASPDAPSGYVRIDELAAQCAADPNKTFIVYAYDHEKGTIVPTYGRQARLTRIDHAWKVTFDNGKVVIGSSNHRLMLRAGTYREIGDLQPGDAMMPFYRKDLFAGAEEGTKGYSWVYTMDDRFRGWTKEHQLIAEWVTGRKLTEDECVHHINFVKTDNRPENLQIMTKSDHSSYHASLNNAVKWAPENRAWIEEFKRNHSAWMRDNAPTARRDVTFARILDVSQQLGFNMRAVSRALDIDVNVIYSRLVLAGFQSYETFARTYRDGFECPDLNVMTLGVNDLSVGLIDAAIQEEDTKKSLATRLGCTVNVLDKFMARHVKLTWSDLRMSKGWEAGTTRHGGRPKGSNGSDLTFQQICDAYEPGLTLPRLSEKLSANKNTVISRLAQNGHQHFSDFTSTYQNCKVVSVEYAGEMPLYDLTVDGYKNFATDSVISHNTPEIAAAMDIYADETCAQDEKGRILHVYSNNEKIKELLEDLFYNVLNVEFNLRSWARNLPVHKDTVIPLLDGRNITIEQLSQEHEAGKQNWVYSVQDGTHRTVPGKVAWCGLTRNDSELVRVWLDDGTYVDCTPDHEWVLRDGSRRRADALLEGESLMPLYRSYASSSKIEKALGYERIYDPASKKMVYTHRVMPLHRWTHSDNGKIVHHVNFNRCDNTPSNLRVMTPEEHVDLHKHLANVYNSSALHKEHDVQRREAMNDLWADPRRKAKIVANMVIKFDQTCVDMVVERLAAHGKYVSPKVLGNQLKADETFMGHFKAINKGTKRDLTKALNSHSGFESLLQKTEVTSYLDLVRDRLPQIALTPWFKRAEKKSTKMSGVVPAMREAHPSSKVIVPNNHKVVRVERLVETSDVYCMTVVGPTNEEDRHNFAVLSHTPNGDTSGSGVYVSNCKYGDFFLYNDVSPEYGVINAFPIPVNEIEREENYDRDDPFAVRYRWVTLGNRTLENWEVTHFRLLGNDMFLPYGSSIIEPARRIWRQLILIEDAMLVYRVVRAPERRVFYIDVANIPPNEVNTYIEQQRQQMRTTPVVDRNTGRVDLRYNPMSVEEDFFIPVRGGESGTKIDTLAGGENTAAVEDVAYVQKKLFAALKIPRAYLGYDEMLSCLTGDTRIPLLSGKTVTVADLVQQGCDDTWVYSCDPSTGKIVPGRVTRVWKTKDVDQVHRVTLDDGTSYDVTENHPFMCRDGSYVRADQLSPGQSLMPLYRKLSSKIEGDFQNGYEKCLDNASNDWVYTHRIVNDAGLVVDHPSRAVEHSYVVHHVNHDKRNNNPSNLVRMGKKAHALYHSCGTAANLLTDASRNKLREVMKTGEYANAHLGGVQGAWDRDDGVRRSHVAVWNTAYKRKDVSTEFFADIAIQSRDRKEFAATVASRGISWSCFRNNLSRANIAVSPWLQTFFGGKSRGSRPKICFTIQQLADCCIKNNVTSITQWRRLTHAPVSGYVLKRVLLENGFKTFSEFAKTLKHNHKVVSVDVIKLSSPVPVYDLEVEGWHNFAIQGCESSQGTVFVHNSKATLAQEDIRFSRTIAVIQKTMMAELNKLSIIHLYSHGFDGEDLQNFTLRLSNPSTVAQQQKLELWRAKFEIGGTAPEGTVSKHFIRKEIMGLNDEQIEKLDEERLAEKQIDDAIEGTAGGVGGGEEGGGGTEDLFGGGEAGGGEAGGGGDEEAGGAEPPEENAGEEPEEETEPEHQLLTGSDDRDDNENFALRVAMGDDKDGPIKPKSQLQKALYNRGRRRTHGASKTHLPDFVKMTGINNHSMEDPFDNDWIKSVISNPFAEAKLNLTEGGTPTFKSAINRGKLAPDIASALGNMARTWQAEINQITTQNGTGMLLEGRGRDVQDEIDAENQTVDVDFVESGSSPSEQLNENEVLIIDDGDDE